VPQRSVVVVPHDLHLDPAAPVFFVSYSGARAFSSASDRNFVRQFFDEVSETVSELLVLPTGQAPGFLDAQLDGGDRWEQKILNAVGRCQFFVPLISPRFLASDWCRFEWETFARRRVRRRTRSPHGPGPAEQTAIIPVSWTAIPISQLPTTITDVQAFTLHDNDRVVRESYRQDGLFGLFRMDLRRSYQVVAYRLARRIVDVVQEYEVLPLVPPDTSGLGKTFREDSP
jgi:hypothetical protein